MKGLLYKEWATLISSYKQSVFFIDLIDAKPFISPRKCL